MLLSITVCPLLIFSLQYSTSSSPYITAVGGTQFQVRSTIGNETTWPGSGGGFSNEFPQPPYQKSAVARWVEIGTWQATEEAQLNLSSRCV